MREGGLWRNAGNDGDESRALGYCCTLLRGEWEPPIAFLSTAGALSGLSF